MNGVSQKSQKLRNTSCHSLRILVPYLGINTKECYLNKLVECKVKFYQIGEAYESQTVNLHKSASWSSNALQIGKAKTGEMASTQKGNIISTDVEDLQSWKLRVKALQSVSHGT